MLADAYYTGEGVERDYAKAAQEGVTKAMAAVSRCYRNGIGVEKNGQDADYWADYETETSQRSFRGFQESMQNTLPTCKTRKPCTASASATNTAQASRKTWWKTTPGSVRPPPTATRTPSVSAAPHPQCRSFSTSP